ncbi:small subunit ribosomal protein S1 [Thermotomaculum hydrothermale]|uniref:Small ribosomal subunit protein bS1 n=1 Tax=Thermotomaculum hydrothermale TaxID=981385 RepID=A0A7R6PRE1_9BACT|nr:30S ribosomal protein S1 [Thermotomaculum hydrothermale]BBB32951.1 small subunit ribosomal protein S1 [Thermotomaculum hydrothermale]
MVNEQEKKLEETKEIKEVTEKIQEESSEKVEPAKEEAKANEEKEEKESFEKLLEEHDASPNSVSRGQIVVGRVISLNDDSVYVDVGHKVEGVVNVNDFIDTGNELPKEGDEIEVVVDKITDKEVRLSFKKAFARKFEEKIREAYRNKTPIKGKITEIVNKGFNVDLGGKIAFLPQSRVDVRRLRKEDSEYVGKEFDFLVIKYTPKSCVVSRIELVQDELNKKKEKLLSSIKEGDLVQGRVKNITDYGVFIDLDGVDGLLHISDISWGKVSHPSDFFQVGDEVEVVILSIDRENEKISLGYKQKMEDPWKNIEEKYPQGTKIKGKVVNIKNYGAFVEVEPGVEGLIHINDISWTKKISNAQNYFKLGDEVEAVVLEVDGERKRLALGLKQIKDNPWDVIEEKFKVGDVFEGEVKNVTDFGAFVEVYDGVDGLIHVSDMSWSKRVKNPEEIVKPGEKVKVKILNIDRENQKIALGIKQLTEDPWKKFFSKYQMGDVVEGKIVKLEDYGAFVELDEDIEGLVHVSEISKERIDKPSDVLNIGDVKEMKIVKVDAIEKKIGLSIRQVIIDRERKEMEKKKAEEKAKAKPKEAKKDKPKKEKKEVKTEEVSKGGGVTLGDLMKDFIKKDKEEQKEE